MIEQRILWVVGVIAIGYVAAALRIGVGEAAQPGSGLYPAIVGVAIVICCAARLALLRRHHRAGAVIKHAIDGTAASTPWMVPGIVAVLIGFGAAQYVIGFVPALGVALYAALRVTGYGTRRRALAIAVAAVAVVFVVFQWSLNVPFPPGALGAWLA